MTLASPAGGRRAFLRLASGIALQGLTLACGWAGEERAAVRRQLRFTLTASNPTERPLVEQRLWLYMPMVETAGQRLAGLRVSMEHERLDDALGHCIVALAFPRLEPYATRLVSLAAEVDLLPGPPAAPLTDPAAWLGAERHIEVDDPDIRVLAATLRRDSAYDGGRAIYDWVRGNLRYAGYLADELGARQALRQRRGDCTEYAVLAVALARANIIPARVVGGFVTDRNAAPRAEDYHNWAQFHMDGAWRLVDAQKGNWLEPAEHYVAFRLQREALGNAIGSAHRFRVAGDMRVRL